MKTRTAYSEIEKQGLFSIYSSSRIMPYTSADRIAKRRVNIIGAEPQSACAVLPEVSTEGGGLGDAVVHIPCVDWVLAWQ